MIQVTTAKIDRVLTEISKNYELIHAAHSTLGISVEDCLIPLIKKTLRDIEHNPNQLELFKKGDAE